MKKQQTNDAFQVAYIPSQASNDHVTSNNAPVATNNDHVTTNNGHCKLATMKCAFSKTILWNNKHKRLFAHQLYPRPVGNNFRVKKDGKKHQQDNSTIYNGTQPDASERIHLRMAFIAGYKT